MSCPHKHAGFTLIEVLISVLVLSVGLLGLASLQLQALKTNQKSYQRSQATVLAYEIADRMRANRDAAVAGSYIYGPSDTGPETNCSSGCADPAQLAQSDLREWLLSVNGSLTLGQGQVACSTDPCTERSMHTVTIYWDEQRDGSVTTDSCGDTGCQRISFMP